jgi:hypothetical protein
MVRPVTFLNLFGIWVAWALAGPAAVSAPPDTPAPADKANGAMSGKKLRDKLAKPVTLEKGFEANTTLKEALEFISNQYDIVILSGLPVESLQGLR